MSPPCLNCHGAPYTTRWETEESLGECRPAEGDQPAALDCLIPLGPAETWADPERLSAWRRWTREHPEMAESDLPFTLSLPPRDPSEPLPECPAEPRWPEWLRTSHPDLQHQTWWVRNNFERSREHPTRLRLDIERAQLDATLHPRWGAALPLVRGWLDLYAGPLAEISTHQVLDHNELPLILNHLVDFSRVSVRGPLGLEIPLQQINVGDFGGLHAVAIVPTWAIFFIQPFMVPVPPPGYDRPPWEQWRDLSERPELAAHCMNPIFAMENIGVCPAPERIPDRRHASSPLDLNLLALLPPRLRCQLEPLLGADESFPQYLNLEDLLALIPQMGNRECPAAAGGGVTPEELRDFMETGEMTLDLEQLNDLFIPGVIDLGASHGRLRVRRLEDGTLTAELSDLEMQIDPIAYGMEEGSSRPRSQIHFGSIRSLPEIHALHLEILPEDNQIRVQTNFHFYLDQEGLIPLLGSGTLEGDLHADLTWVLTPEGYRPVPGTLTVEIQDLEIRGDTGQETRLQVSLTDDPARMDAVHGALAAVSERSEFRFRVSGLLQGHDLDLEGEIAMRRDARGLYLMPRGETLSTLLRNLPVEEILLQFQDLFPRGREGLSGEAHLVNLTPPLPEPGAETPPHLQISFSAEHLRPDRRHPGSLEPVPLIPHGLLDFEYFEQPRETPLHEQGELAITLDAFDWPLALGGIELRDVNSRLTVDRLRISDEESWVRIPSFSIVANPHGAPRGLVRGEVRVEQRGGEGLEFVWNSRSRRLEMRGLDLRLSAQGLAVLPDRLRRTLNPEVAGLGIDGHLRGDFAMHLTEDRRCWHGEGEIGLRGDTEGDIYFSDDRGRRVGPALFRDTRWSFRRVNWINWERGYALGSFHLQTLLNPSAAPGFSVDFGRTLYWTESEPLFGPGGIRLLPYEVAAIMAYDNQPWSGIGFRHRIEDYILNLYLSPQETLSMSSPRIPSYCRESDGGDR